ncbi:hypothetical protein [Hydrogenophaga sp.]|uniref:hypothetical protein n=1 Tax=Hydrogenophaga sp. TaxID=1904254 RepID=UPI003F719B41
MPIASLDSLPTLKQLIAERQADLELSDHDLALAMGYDSPTVVTMIKSGGMRFPINKARALADVLHVEPGAVMRMLLGETSPEMLKGIEDCLGPLSLTRTEVRLIRKLREAAAGEATSPLFLDGNSVVAIITRK